MISGNSLSQFIPSLIPNDHLVVVAETDCWVVPLRPPTFNNDESGRNSRLVYRICCFVCVSSRITHEAKSQHTPVRVSSEKVSPAEVYDRIPLNLTGILIGWPQHWINYCAGIPQSWNAVYLILEIPGENKFLFRIQPQELAGRRASLEIW
jgi:hypothetical protein